MHFHLKFWRRSLVQGAWNFDAGLGSDEAWNFCAGRLGKGCRILEEAFGGHTPWNEEYDRVQTMLDRGLLQWMEGWGRWIVVT